MDKKKRTKPLTPRQLAQYKLMKEMGVFSRMAKKRGTQLRDEEGNDYFKDLRAKRKSWPKKYRRNTDAIQKG